MIGGNELLVVLLVSLIFLGPKRLIEVIRAARGESDTLDLSPSSPVEQEDALIFHLEELRKRLIYSLISIIPTTVVCFFFAPQIINFLRRPYGGKLIFISPPEAFIVNIKVAIGAGIILAFPFIAYQIWKFVAPGLYPNEKKIFLGLIFLSTLLFVGGVSFCYFFIVPLAFKFLLKFSYSWFEPLFTVGKYFSFLFKLMIAFGLVFQTPIVILFLIATGVTTPKALSRYRRHIYVLSFVLGAVLTPPDVLSQILMSMPLILLFELSLLMGKMVVPKREGD
ncbi:sec-independent protein translocase protein TatC [Thermosulfidibacter takaii ABI70S6]|uniref:Sec-independent protein translocase protein TatC n=1 Tax=Thermosulfidibacter takaii (strain DSM 17441 / JCM 13301 / NBRC 103674 / ABI70S6) TaxID=1298851 RepID=A0A0S3QUE5_THET7|nr:twin-arginine translocase subunit TatC [Thermosulfidibacter takaii]BAT71941.1 sec-independent protein translocase protein TatC [Thermosulfidibacter takaii ABI70S6]